MSPPPSPLDDPDQAAFAWRRYKRLMLFMALVTALTVAAALVVLYRTGALVSIHFIIATGLGIAAAMMLMAALMGLVFLSNGTGHDDAVADFEDTPRPGPKPRPKPSEPEYRGPRPPR
ncbi:hypothetical protein ACOYW6_11050 [Parablastomonas sp. CN1-191]|uniref:hypothetical protein n=1 Tax=Parablastomonas sp. CN1-191 TaxID=3400908 RepID=UPI003BF7B638